MKLLVQPSAGITPLVKAIEGAKKSVEIFIFRFDRRDIERALANAVKRGVFVHALTAYTNRGGEKNLRKLEMQLLAAGVTVTRTSDDLLRYHGKLLIVDRRELYLFAFNFTFLDIMRSRSFGIITQDKKLIREAVRLFDADSRRRPYSPGLASFVISPLNARKQLGAFIKAAKKELLIYDPKISDPDMIQLLEERAKAGVKVRVIGRLTRRTPQIDVRKLPRLILHTRTIVRDRQHGFIGSQSLRKAELDDRREVGVLFQEAKVVNGLAKTFEEDWALTVQPQIKQSSKKKSIPAAKAARKMAKAVARDLPPVAEVLKQVVKNVVGERSDLGLDAKQVEESVNAAVEEAVKDVVKGAVKDAVQEAVEQNS